MLECHKHCLGPNKKGRRKVLITVNCCCSWHVGGIVWLALMSINNWPWEGGNKLLYLTACDSMPEYVRYAVKLTGGGTHFYLMPFSFLVGFRRWIGWRHGLLAVVSIHMQAALSLRLSNFLNVLVCSHAGKWRIFHPTFDLCLEENWKVGGKGFNLSMQISLSPRCSGNHNISIWSKYHSRIYL